VIYMHVLKMGGSAVRSPLGALVARARPLAAFGQRPLLAVTNHSEPLRDGPLPDTLRTLVGCA